MNSAAALLLAMCLGAAGGCTPEPTPEQQVRAVVAAAEAAAESRDHRALMSLVSRQYADARGGDARELSLVVHAYLVAHPAVRLATRTESVRFPYEDMAQVRVTVGTLAREAGGNAANFLDVAADLHTVEFELQREGDEWKVIRAEWNSLVGI
jgi:hypothetical protein